MVKVNLLPKEDLEKKAIGKFLKWTLSYGRYIIIIVELIVFLVFFSRFIYDQKLADIRERVEQKQAIVASASDFEQKIHQTQMRIEQVKSLEDGRAIYITVLDRLKEIIPLDMVFTDLEFQNELLSISGETETNESFAKFITSLKLEERLFAEISIESVGKKETEDKQESNIVEFEISATIEGFRQEPTPTPELPTAGSIPGETDETY